MRRIRLAESGFSMVEILIVISIIGIIASIAIPRFIEQKDSATLAATAANLNNLQNCLSHYAATSLDNRYPGGPLNYNDFIAKIPDCKMPSLERDAKIRTASFSYLSTGTTYNIYATSTNRAETHFIVAPTGIKHN